MNFVMVETDKPREAAPNAREAAAEPPASQFRRVRQVGEMVTALSVPKAVANHANKSDRRWALRKRTETPGYIGHAKNPQGVRCIVRNTSSSGALVEVLTGSDRFANPADEIPDQLTLVFISYKERTEVACAVMRRSGRMLGVRYVGSFRTYPTPAAMSKVGTNYKKR